MSNASDTLTNLHDHYVEAVNMAVADGDDARVARLAAEFDLEATELSAGAERGTSSSAWRERRSARA